MIISRDREKTTVYRPIEVSMEAASETEAGKAVSAPEDIYPKVTNPERKFFPGYPEFQEITGSLPGEIVLLAPCGGEVPSLYEGVVTEAVTGNRWNSGYGNYIRLDIIGGGSIIYAHFDKILVSAGDEIGKGDGLGIAGKSGLLPEDAQCLFGVIGF